MEQDKSAVNKTSDKALYFTKISVDDIKKVREWLWNELKIAEEIDIGIPERKFLRDLESAVFWVNYDYWIANLEPSINEGKIHYSKGEKPGGFFSPKQYMEMAKNYAPERGSRLAFVDELLVWYALRIVNKQWTLQYVASDSSSDGNYRNAPNMAGCMEPTGVRKCGGYYDGQGNTRKIATEGFTHKYALLGGTFCSDGDKRPVGKIDYNVFFDSILFDCTGVVVLTR